MVGFGSRACGYCLFLGYGFVDVNCEEIENKYSFKRCIETDLSDAIYHRFFVHFL